MVSLPDILSGTPVVRVTRVPVYDVAASVTAGIPVDRVLAAYPSLNADKVDLAVLYAEANPPRGRPRQSAELPESAVVITDRRLALASPSPESRMKLLIDECLSPELAKLAQSQSRSTRQPVCVFTPRGEKNGSVLFGRRRCRC